MSKIAKYRENIYAFLTTKSCFSHAIDKAFIKEVVDSELCMFPIALLSIFSTQVKKNKIKSYHALHMASAIILMTMIVMVKENIEYYKQKYGIHLIAKIVDQATIYILEAVSQNMKTMDNALESTITVKIQKKIDSFLHEKLLTLTDPLVFDDTKKNRVKKSDVIKYHFTDPEATEAKYKKLYRINQDTINDYINNKYGIIGQCSFLFGWLMGTGDSSAKMIDNILRLGNTFGTLVKMTYDFNNLEVTINNAKDISYNYIVNCGIYECFKLFDESRVKYVEGCMIYNIYSGAIKEQFELIDDTYDECLKKAELELESQYSSYISTRRSKNSTKSSIKSNVA